MTKGCNHPQSLSSKCPACRKAYNTFKLRHRGIYDDLRIISDNMGNHAFYMIGSLYGAGFDVRVTYVDSIVYEADYAILLNCKSQAQALRFVAFILKHC